MKHRIKAEPIQILLVEDDPDDVELIMETFKRTKITMNLDVVKNGVEAMEFLHKEGKYENETRPDLIFLDLNLPKMGGQQVLEKIKNDNQLKTIPVVVLTSSTSNEDILKSYELQANSYIKKPIGLEEFTQMVQVLSEFWFTLVRLPPNKEK